MSLLLDESNPGEEYIDGYKKQVLKEPFNDFLFSLRGGGIGVSTSEWLDLQQAFSVGLIVTLEDLYTAGKTLLIKDPLDMAKYDELFVRRFYLKTDEENDYEYLEDKQGRRFNYDEFGKKAYFNKDGVLYNWDDKEDFYSFGELCDLDDPNRLYMVDEDGERIYAESFYDDDGTNELYFEKYGQDDGGSDIRIDIDLDDFPKIEDQEYSEGLEGQGNETTSSSGETNELQDVVTEAVANTVDSKPPKEIKDQLGTKELTSKIPEGSDDQEESKHGGDEDQHNDILQQQDENKIGGGYQKLTKTTQDHGMIGGGGEKKGEKGEGQGEGRGNERKMSKIGGLSGGGEQGDGSGSGGTALKHGKQEEYGGNSGRQVEKSGLQEQVESKSLGESKKELKLKKKLIKKKTLRKSQRHKSSSNKAKAKVHVNFDRDKIIDYSMFGRVLSRLRNIVSSSSEHSTRKIDEKATVTKIARHGGIPQIVFREVIEVKPKLIVLVDVGGSVDPYRDITLKLIRGATKGSDLENVEVYYFHNAIYGYVWPEKEGNWRKSEIPIEHLIKQEESTKLLIIGDAWMAEDEYWDTGMYGGENEKPMNQGIPFRTGEESFDILAQRFGDNVVWVNPLTQSQQTEDDSSGTIAAISSVFPMFELTYRGLEGAVEKLID